MIKKAILSKALSEGLAVLKLDVPEVIQEKMITYIELLVKWNAVHNLTAVRDPIEMVTRHVLDSLVLLPYLEAHARVLDVGTGAGLPGILLALSRPQQSFVLLDSHQKKIAFVQHVILSLKVTNVVAVCERVEKYHPTECFDWVVSRAFASLSDFVTLSHHLCKRDGKLVAMKGAIDPTEVAAMPADYTIEKIASVKVPGLTAERTLVFINIKEKGAVGVK